jgi:hypothetical protein
MISFHETKAWYKFCKPVQAMSKEVILFPSWKRKLYNSWSCGTYKQLHIYLYNLNIRRYFSPTYCSVTFDQFSTTVTSEKWKEKYYN